MFRGPTSVSEVRVVSSLRTLVMEVSFNPLPRS